MSETFQGKDGSRTIRHVAKGMKETPPGKSARGDRLFYARFARGLTLDALVARTDGEIQRPTLIAAEHGRNQLSGVQSREAVARGLGVTADSLSRYLDGEYGEPSANSANRFLKEGSAGGYDLTATFEQALGRLVLRDSARAAEYAAVADPKNFAFDKPELLTVEHAVEQIKLAAAAARGETVGKPTPGFEVLGRKALEGKKPPKGGRKK